MRHIDEKDLEVETLCGVASASRASPLVRVSVKEKHIALVAEAPVRLHRAARKGGPVHIPQAKHESLRYMTAASWTGAFGRVTVKEHGAALVAETPIILALPSR